VAVRFEVLALALLAPRALAAALVALAVPAALDVSTLGAASLVAPVDFDLRRRPDEPDDPEPEPDPEPDPDDPEPEEPDPRRDPDDPEASGNGLPSLEERGRSGDDRTGLVVERVWGRRVGKPALADRETERPTGGLGRYRVRVFVG
jgi:hypothetical protein